MLETLDNGFTIMVFAKVCLLKICWLFCQFYYNMRIVNTLCVSREKKLYSIMLISLLTFLRKISKLPWMEGFWMPVKDVQEWSGVCLEQNWMFVERGEEAGGGPKFRLFCGRRKWMTHYQITVCYWIFFFLCLLTLCSFIVFFIVLNVK